MKPLRLIIVLVINTLVSNSTSGQVNEVMSNNTLTGVQKVEMPEVGKPMPNFILDNIKHYKIDKASLNDFRGKWLIIDFWMTTCVPCIKSFPKIDSFQRKFQNQIQFMLVGVPHKGLDGIENLYEGLRVKQNLILPIAFDSTLYKVWGPFSVPHIYIIDPNGTLVSITDGRDMSISKLQELVNNKKPTFFIESDNKSVYAKDRENIEIDSSTLFQSKLSKFTEGRFFIQPIDYQLNYSIEKRNGYKSNGIALQFLYNLAYFGKHYWTRRDSLYTKVYRQPIFELKDQSVFNWSDKTIHGLYNYIVTLPSSKVTKEYLMNWIRQDLSRYFGYAASIEKRKMPVWLLIAKPGAIEKLKSKGGTPNTSDKSGAGGAGGVTLTNTPGVTLILILERYLNQMILTPFFDEANLNYNIDIKIDALMSDIEAVRKNLKEFDLDIVKGEREMEVLVIKDK